MTRPLAWPALALVLLSVTAPAARADLAPGTTLSKIAFGSCADQGKPLPIYGAIVDAKPDLLLLLGDNIYADLDRGRKVTPEVIKEKYDILAGLPEWQRLKAACPMLATWDDHDFGKNDGGAEFEIKDESQKLFHDFFGTPADSPRRSRKGVYDAHVFGPVGKRVQVILLDTRSPRPTPPARSWARSSGSGSKRNSKSPPSCGSSAPASRCSARTTPSRSGPTSRRSASGFTRSCATRRRRAW